MNDPALAPSAAASSPAVDAQRLQALCARAVEAETEASLRPLLELLRRLLGAQGVAWLEEPSQHGRLPDAAVSSRLGGGAALVALRPSLDRRRALAGSAPGTDEWTLSVPVAVEGEHRGWLVAQLPVRSPRDVPALLVLLQMASGYVLYHEQRRATAALGEVLERASGLLELFRTAGGELDYDLACRQAVEAVRDELGCSRVALGTRRFGRWRLQAISGLSKLDWKSAAHQPLEAALREAVAAGQPVDWTPDLPCLPETSAHELLAQSSGAGRLLTLPLPHGSGALLLEWPAEAGALRDPRLAGAAAGFLPVLFHLLRRARPHPVAYSAGHWWGTLARRKKLLVLAGAMAVAGILACPFHYSVGADCRLEPVVKQVVAAPFPGLLRHSRVRPGDVVKEGDLLGELDARELKMKEAELLAAREHALKQRDRSLANSGEGSDFAAAQVADFEARSVAEELALVRRKISLLEVRAPLSGTVISGDLRRAEGQPIQQGQVLWEIAPLERMIAEVEVPDREISRVRAGQSVSLHLEAFAAGSWQSTIERVHPQSETAEGRNVFICEVPMAGGAELRPGMRGRAAVTTDRRPLAWILGHRLWEWTVTTLFW